MASPCKGLHFCAGNHGPASDLLIKAGADVNENKCWNPIRDAAREGRKEALQLLIEKGADVNLPYDIDTALLAAVTMITMNV